MAPCAGPRCGRFGSRVARRLAGRRGGGRRGAPEGRASGSAENAGIARVCDLPGRSHESRHACGKKRACGAGDGESARFRARSEPGALPGQLPAARRRRGGLRRIGADGYGSRAAHPAGRGACRAGRHAARPARPSADPAARTRADFGRDAGAAPAALRHEIFDAPRPRGLKSCGEPPQDPSKNDD